MAGTIQVKRSANTATPTTLEFGELAWSSNGQVLHIGREASNTSNLVAISGTRTPGTLTANQALVANSTSSINEIRAVNTVANVTMTGTSTANLYNVHVRGSLKDSNGNALEIYNSSGTKIWG